jgi:hypothetical protein
MTQFLTDGLPYHHVQRHVLLLLKEHSTLEYAQLKPVELTGNAFNYHLRALLKTDFVEMNDGLYSLTDQGRLFADVASTASMKVRVRPAHGVLLLIECGDKVMLYESKRQPLIGHKGLVFGKQRIGGSWLDTITFNVCKRHILGEHMHEPEFMTAFSFRYFDDDTLVAHRSGTVWKIVLKESDFEPIESVNGLSHWVDKSAANGCSEYELLSNLKSGYIEQDIRVN